jgi:hypothetical protein
MSSVLDPVPPANPFTRPVASLTGANLYDEAGVLGLQLVTGKGTAAKAKWYALEAIPTQLGGRAFRLTPATGDNLAAGETDYVVLLAGPDSSCTCPGHTYSGGCKHVSALLHFQAEGRFQP